MLCSPEPACLTFLSSHPCCPGKACRAPRIIWFFCSWIFYSTSILNQLLPEPWGRLRPGEFFVEGFCAGAGGLEPSSTLDSGFSWHQVAHLESWGAGETLLVAMPASKTFPQPRLSVSSVEIFFDFLEFFFNLFWRGGFWGEFF